MSFDTSWDVEKYYSPHEPPEHWEMKRKFMLAHKTKFPEQKLVSLATTFLNVEIMGCSYNPKLMNHIKELSKGIVEDYREYKKQKVQKVFVAASDAAASKVRGHMATPSGSVAFVSATVDSYDMSNTYGEQEPVPPVGFQNTSYTDDNQEMSPMYSQNEQLPFYHDNKGHKRRRCEDDMVLQPEVPEECKTCYGNLVLIEDEGPHVMPTQIIERSASLCSAKLAVLEERCESTNTTTITIRIRGKLLATGSDFARKKARELAYQQALEKLQAVCYTIKIKQRHCYEQPVDKNFGGDGAEIQNEEVGSTSGPGNIGLKMMESMGWTGGGLGKAQQGITEPISLQLKVNRTGFGIQPKETKGDTSETEEEVFKRKATAYLETYANNNTEEDLVFTTEFTNEERKFLHQLSARFDLKSRSYGKQENRHLVISRKLKPFVLLKSLLTSGGESKKYELLYPTSLQKQING